VRSEWADDGGDSFPGTEFESTWDSVLATEGYVVGIEVSGRGQRVAVADLRGQILERTPIEGDITLSAEELRARLRTLVTETLARLAIPSDRVIRIGIAFGGPVDAGRGVILYSPRTPGYDNLPIAAVLENDLRVPTFLDNDARAAALGEAIFGAGRGEEHIIYVHLGTGVGGGLILNGQLQQGVTTTAGEIGNVIVNPEATEGGGRPGRLEAYASARAIVQRYRQRLAAAGGAPSRAGTMTPRKVFEAAAEGDLAAQETVDEAVRMLGLALANLVTTLNPGVIIVGGQVAEAGSLLFEPLRTVIRQYAMDVPGRAVRLAPAELKTDAPLVGAVAMALQSLNR
jgi:glucokinase